MQKKLYKSETDKKVCGVCGGIGEYFNIDPTLVRLLCVLLGLCAGGLIAYIVALIIIPEATADQAGAGANGEAQPTAEATSTEETTPTEEAKASGSDDETTPTLL